MIGDAYFDCVVAYIDESGNTFTFKGENKGTISGDNILHFEVADT